MCCAVPAGKQRRDKRRIASIGDRATSVLHWYEIRSTEQTRHSVRADANHAVVTRTAFTHDRDRYATPWVTTARHPVELSARHDGSPGGMMFA